MVVVIGTSCKKSFLDENQTTARNDEFYKTDAGIISLVNGAYYNTLSLPFSGEYPFSTMNYGTDEFHVGGDNSNIAYTSYGNADNYWSLHGIYRNNTSCHIKNDSSKRAYSKTITFKMGSI